MARLLANGAEFNDPTGLDVSTVIGQISLGTAGITIGSSPVNTGGFAWTLASGAGNATRFLVASFSTSLAHTYYGRAYFNFTQLPTAGSVQLIIATAVVSCRLTSGGKLQLWNETGTPAQIGSNSDLTLTTGVWYRIEWAWLSNAGSVDTAELRVATGDGAAAVVVSATGLALSDSAISWTNIGWNQAPGANCTCTVDDIAFNDDTGANQNTWLGPGRIVVLVPTGDSARGSLWLNGAGTTTALWDAVNNLPPVGKLTASKTAITQIEHTGGTAQSYDATMTTYTVAGVPSYAVINLVLAVVVHGEDIATGTKVLTHSIVSNPAVASAGNYNAGNDAGACGTYPTLWTTALGTLTYAPTVTVNTAPIMRATRPSTDTRTADICFMGILVDFSPLPVRPSMNEAQAGLTLNQAPMRAATW